MSVPAAYIGMILIWSTTPLAVQWSNGSFSPITAATLRLSVAWILALALAALLRNPALQLRKNWRLYAAASLALFPSMPLVYWAAQYIPSGLIAVIFGLSPFFVALLAVVLLGDRSLGRRHLLALCMALGGLVVIYQGQGLPGRQALPGIGLMLVSVAGFSLSSVLVKRYGGAANPLAQLNGSLLFAMPGMLLTWLLVDGSLPQAVTAQSGFAVLYLAVVGSLFGFVAYFYLLHHMSVTSVSVIPLITPAFALMIGVQWNHEPMGFALVAGTGLILSGLALFNLAGKVPE